MLDLVLAVDDPYAWHSQNLKMNRGHYSWLKYFGPDAIVAVQHMAAGIYYNTVWPVYRINNYNIVPTIFILICDMVGLQSLKYGVISTSHLIRDLQRWDTFYVAGRMQKPVLHRLISTLFFHRIVYLLNIIKLAR